MRAGPVPRPAVVAVAWAAIVAVMVAMGGDYRLSVAVGAGVLAVAAVGVDLSVGSGGMLVFSAPAFMLMGALASGLVGLHSGLEPTAATLVGLAAGLAAGSVLALVTGLALRRVNGIGVALLTLFVLHLVRGVVRQQEGLGGTLGLSGIPPFELGGFRADTPATQAVVVMVALALVLAAATRFVTSGPGRELRAVRGDPGAAAACGVGTARRRLEAFVLGSLCASLAGSLYAHTLGYVSADALGLGVLMDLLLMVFVGGAGSVWGAAVGALAVRMVPELWLGPERFDVVARGAAFLLVLTLAPGGLAGAARTLAARLPRRRPVPRAEPGPPMAPAPVLARPAPAERGPILHGVGLIRSFGGVRALDGVDLTLDAGELCAVIGANGAGKTTLFNLLAGSLRPDEGRVELAGVDITALPPNRRARLGIARTFQEVRLFPGLSVLDHALVGTGSAGDLEAAHHALAVTGLTAVAGMPADELPFGGQRRVELARALAARPAVLLLDEPASGLSRSERGDLLEVIRRAATGAAVLVVEHDVEFVFALTPRVVVLDGGRVIFDGASSAALVDPAVLDSYLGYRQVAGR